jgi:hypothetical protein
MHTPRDNQRSTNRRTLTVIVLTAAITATFAVAAMAAATTFVDVRAGDTHEDGIDFMLESGVTVGCAANAYCPDDPVTRAQMATFMHRLSGTADGIDPSVDAATLGGLTAQQIQDGVEPDGGGLDTAIYTARVSVSGDLVHGMGVDETDLLEISGNPAYSVEFPEDVDVDVCAVSVTASPGGTFGIPSIERAFSPDNGVLITFADPETGQNAATSVTAFDLIAVC